MPLGRNVHRLVHARQADGFIRRHLLHTPLRLHAHRPAGRIQLNVGFLVWPVRLVRFAVYEQVDPALDGAKPVPRRRKTNALSSRDAAGLLPLPKIVSTAVVAVMNAGDGSCMRSLLHAVAVPCRSPTPLLPSPADITTSALCRRQPCPRCAQKSRTTLLRAVSAQRKPGRSRAPVILFTRHANVSRAECLVTSGSRYAVFSGPQIEREIVFFPCFGRIALNPAYYIEIVFLRF